MLNMPHWLEIAIPLGFLVLLGYIIIIRRDENE